MTNKTSTSLAVVDTTLDNTIDTTTLSVVTSTTNVRVARTDESAKALTGFEIGRILYNLLKPHFEFGVIATALDYLISGMDIAVTNKSDNIVDIAKKVLDRLIATDNNITNGKKIITYSVISNKVDSQRDTLILTVLLQAVA